MTCLTILESDFYSAKRRLQAAQMEKLEAAAEFTSARAALRQALETVWPPRCECGKELETEFPLETTP